MGRNNLRQAAERFPHLSWRMVAAYSCIFVAAPILTFFIGSFLDRMLLLPAFPPFPLNSVAGSIVLLFGLAIGIKATRLLYYKGRGLPWGEAEKQVQSTRLVTTSLYACCRHPMTFGYSLLPCGMGILFRSLAMTVFIPVSLFSVMILWLKLREEPRLERRFGQAYQDYKRQTPFMIPRFKPLILDLKGSIASLLHREKTGSSRRSETKS